MDISDIIFASLLGIIVGMFSIFAFFVTSGDNADLVNTNVFGYRLCESQGLVYDHRDMVNTVPVIHCRENKTVSVYDGVVVFDGGKQ